MKLLKIVFPICFFTAGCESSVDPNNSPGYTPPNSTWSTLESFQSSSASDASANAVAFDSSDRLWVAGFAGDSVGTLHWTIRSATSLAQNFSTSDSYQLTANFDSQANALTTTSDGTVWAAGQALDSNLISHWIVRSLPVNGLWTTVDDFQLNAGFSAEASAIVADDSGDIFVGGFATDSAGSQHALVREKLANGSWQTSDNYQPVAGTDAYITGLSFDALHTLVYSSGFEAGTSGKTAFTRSFENSVWSSGDAFQFSTGQDSVILSIASDEAGNLYSVGYGSGTDGVNHWTVRTIPWGGNWSTLDSATLVTGQSAFGQGIAANAQGLYAVGYAIDSRGAADWLTRVLDTGSVFGISEDFNSSGAWLGSAVTLNAAQIPVVVGGHSNGTSLSWIVRALQ